MMQNNMDIRHDDEWFAITRWHPDDIIGIAAEHGVTLTREQATQWWKENEAMFKSRLVEVGNEILNDMVSIKE